jgi:hypothetical protein
VHNRIVFKGTRIRARANREKRNIFREFGAFVGSTYKNVKEYLATAKKKKALAIATMKVKQKNETAETRRQNVFREFSAKVRSEFNIAEISVYFSDSGSGENILHRFGADNVGNIALENYFSLSASTLLISPTGLSEAPEYKSRLVTRIKLENSVYLVVFSSFALETFKGCNAQYVLEMLAKVSERIDERQVQGSEHFGFLRQESPQKV